MTGLAQLGLFLSSFAPLFAVFALLGTFGPGWPTRVCVAIAALGLVLLPTILAIARRLAPQRFRATSASARDGDAIAYVATYLVPFAAMAGTTTRERIAIAVFLSLVTVLYVRSQLFYINPLLAAVGYHVYEIETSAGASVVLLSRRRYIPPNCELWTRRLGEYVHWETTS